LEPALGASLTAAKLDSAHRESYQFERHGYFIPDTRSTAFNRTVTLRDSWAKAQQPARHQTSQKAIVLETLRFRARDSNWELRCVEREKGIEILVYREGTPVSFTTAERRSVRAAAYATAASLERLRADALDEVRDQIIHDRAITQKGEHAGLRIVLE
jgi:hypothetical protein